eukprot:2788230-Pyramimonas_sp.AAC.1
MDKLLRGAGERRPKVERGEQWRSSRGKWVRGGSSPKPIQFKNVIAKVSSNSKTSLSARNNAIY